jgi:hypothetical protein
MKGRIVASAGLLIAALVIAAWRPATSDANTGYNAAPYTSRYQAVAQQVATVAAEERVSALETRIANLEGFVDGAVNRINDQEKRIYALELLAYLTPTLTPTSAPVPPTATPAPSATPIAGSIIFRGITAGTAINGVANIEAVVEGVTPATVVFSLAGAATDTRTEAVAPYFYFGDFQGAPFGWDTKAFPNGNYTLTAIAYDADGKALTPASSISFSIDNAIATVTAAPTATAAPVATSTPLPSGVTRCAVHDPRRWHGLYDPENNCYHDHEHGQDPHALDDVFGTAIYATMGGYELGYPWQTSMTMPSGHIMMENDVWPNGKHQGYKIFTREGLPCRSVFGSQLCVTDMRFWVHFVGSELDANAQRHSFYGEARVCEVANPTRCGIIRAGRHLNFGTIVLDGQPLGAEVCRTNGKLHYYNTGNRNFVTWYPCDDQVLAVSVQASDTWDYFTPGAMPRNGISLCTGQSSADNYNLAENRRVYANTCGNDNSKRQLHGVFGNTPSNISGATVSNGLISYKGFTNRFGQIVQGCTMAAPDCIPYELLNVPAGKPLQYRDDFFTDQPAKNMPPGVRAQMLGAELEHDPRPDLRLIQYPN